MQPAKIRSSIFAITLLALSAIDSSSAFAAGYEKVTTWSGRFTGMASSASAPVTGAESLYFNPAGLAGSLGTEVSLNFSPTLGKYYGPITAPNTQLESSRKLSPVFGALVSTQLTEQFGIGIGAFVAGGTKAIYEDVDFSGVSAAFNTLKPTVESSLSVTELSLGAAYELIPGLRFGLAWRVSMVNATLSSAAVVPVAPGVQGLANIAVDDLTKTRFNGWRLGAQYTAPQRAWGVGVNWRTPVTFTATGTGTRRVQALPNAVTETALGDVQVSSIFPSQVSIGAFVQPVTGLMIAPEYVWTEYSQAKSLNVAGFTIPQNWQNQTNLKLGAEYKLSPELAVRAGYAWTSEVTPKNAARASFASPGTGNTITLGAGTAIMDKKLDLNGAVEYSFASGTVTAADSGGTALPGEYKTNAWVIHLGANYRL